MKKKLIIFFCLLLAGLLIYNKSQKKYQDYQLKIGDRVFQNNLLDKKFLYSGVDLKGLKKINIKNGKVIWEFRIDEAVFSNIEKIGNKLFFITGDNTFFCLNANNGKIIWQKIFEQESSYDFDLINKKIMIYSLKGQVVLLNLNGRTLWQKELNSNENITSEDWQINIQANNNYTYFIQQNYLGKINLKNGDIFWEQTFDSNIDSNLQVAGQKLFFKLADNSFLMLNDKYGNIINHFTDENKIDDFISTQEKNIVLAKIIFNFAKNLSENASPLYFLKSNEKNLVTKLKLNLDQAWQLDLETNYLKLIFKNNEKLIFRTDHGLICISQRGKIIWQKELSGLNQIVGKKNNKELISLNDKGQLSLIKIKNGNSRWLFNTNSEIDFQIIESKKEIILIGENGVVYKIPKNIVPKFRSVNIKSKVENQLVKDGEIFKIDFYSREKYFINPFYQTKINCQFKNVDQENEDFENKYHKNGFYYELNHWQVRFNPMEKGNWSWQCSFSAPGLDRSFSGDFVNEKNSSIVPIKNEVQPKNLNYVNENKLIWPIGINTAIGDTNNNHNFYDDFFIGENKKVALDEYLDTYFVQNGFNTFRWNPGNAQFWLAGPFAYPENGYSFRAGKSGDMLVEELFKRDIMLYFTPFTWSLPYGVDPSEKEKKSLEHYLEYVIARYGAYTSIWEVTNEGVISDENVIFLANIIKELDPGKMTSVSWEKPQLDEIDIIAPHWYMTSQKKEADLDLIKEIEKFKNYNKPVIFGEIGNVEKNWDENSALIMRVRAWTALFHQTGLIFWNISNTKDFYSKTFGNANQYIGEKERQYLKIVSNFAKNLSASIHLNEFAQNIQGNNIRAYSMQSEQELVAYLYHFTNQETTTEAQIELNLSTGGQLQWINPIDGTVLKEQIIKPGFIQLKSPSFKEDLALKIIFENSNEN